MLRKLFGKRKRKGIGTPRNSTEEVDAAEVPMSFEELLATSPGRRPLLCPVCEKIFEGELEVSVLGVLVPRHHDLNSLKDSVKAGCYICNTIVTKLARSYPQPFKGDPPFTTSYYVGNNSTSVVSLGISLLLDAGAFGASAWLHLQFHLQPSKGKFNDSYRSPTLVASNYKLAQNTSSAACWDLVLQWLRNCTENHHEHCVNPNPEYLPKRVIDVGAAEEDELYLCTDVSRGGNKARYMTLSHRWGSAKIPTLSSANMSEMQRGFKLSSLPRTFREAIIITRRLGIRYLWIDSLCILQDSELDWQEEAATMKDVYGNSYCNIAAAGARNSDEGLFVDRDALSLQPCPVALTWKGETRMNYGLAEAHLQNDLETEPLNKRAWFYQERLLAPRVLYFASEQIYWECMELFACEIFPEGMDSSKKENFREIRQVYDKQKLSSEVSLSNEDPSNGNLFKIKSSIRDGSEGSFISQNTSDKPYMRAQWCYRWECVVKDYSWCDMTRESDKLVALSGIAKFFKDKYEQKYLAGLWREDLVLELLWTVRYPSQISTRPSSRRPETYRAPSWSWASIDGKIFWHDERKNEEIPLIRIVDVYTLPVTTDETGQVTGGRLTVVGDLVKCQIRAKDGRCVIYLSLEESKFQVWVKALGVPLTWKTLFKQEIFCYEDVTQDFSQTFSEYCLLPVLRFTRGIARARRGLILKRTSDAGHYVRRGLFYSDDCVVRTYGMDLVYEASKRQDLFSSPDFYADPEQRILHIL